MLLHNDMPAHDHPLDPADAATLAIDAAKSGCAGLAGLRKAAADANARSTLGFDASSPVLLIDTEGATDQKWYEEIVGYAPDQIAV